MLRWIGLILLMQACTVVTFHKTSEEAHSGDLQFFRSADPMQPSASLMSYNVASPLWSDGAAKFRYLYVPDGAQLSLNAENQVEFPVGSILFKHFAARDDGGGALETRILHKQEEGWAFTTYQWNENGSSQNISAAVVLESGYRIPSTEECTVCHRTSTQEVLGFQPEQIAPYAAELLSRGWVDETTKVKLEAVTLQDDPRDESLTTAQRALAYLDVNCGSCHRPLGANGYPLLNRENIDVAWLKSKKYVVPGQLDQSKIWQRFSATSNRMPPTSVVIDPLGLELIQGWIKGFDD